MLRELGEDKYRNYLLLIPTFNKYVWFCTIKKLGITVNCDDLTLDEIRYFSLIDEVVENGRKDTTRI